MSTAAFCIPGTENLHLVFSYSVWVLRDFPEDGLKVGVVERDLVVDMLSAIYGNGIAHCKKLRNAKSN